MDVFDEAILAVLKDGRGRSFNQILEQVGFSHNTLRLHLEHLVESAREQNKPFIRIIDFESDEWHVAHTRNLEEESKLIEAGFEYVRFSERDNIAIYRKRK